MQVWEEPRDCRAIGFFRFCVEGMSILGMSCIGSIVVPSLEFLVRLILKIDEGF